MQSTVLLFLTGTLSVLWLLLYRSREWRAREAVVMLAPEEAAGHLRRSKDILLLTIPAESGAVQLPLSRGSVCTPLSLLSQQIGRYAPDRGTALFVCCDASDTLQRAALLLRELGYLDTFGVGATVELERALRSTSE